MADRLPKTSRPISALLVGLIVTVMVAGAHYAGLDRWAELKTLDLRFRLLPGGPDDERVVCVEIDRRSLEALGDWPWPRERIAGLTQMLHVCGADTIVLDVPLSHPQAPRYEAPSGPPPVPGAVLGAATEPPTLLFDDAMLADDMRAHKGVIVPVRLDLRQPERLPAEAAVEAALQERVTLTPEEAAAAVPGSRMLPDDVFARVKRRVIEGRVSQVLSADAGKSLEDVCAIVLGEPAFRAEGAGERGMARRAYLGWQSMRALRRFGVGEEATAGHPVRSARAEPPVAIFVEAAAGAGFVAPEASADGVTRHVRLLARAGSTVLPHLALAAAHRELGLRHGGSEPISADPRGVVIPTGRGGRRGIPTDAEGRMLINWAADETARRISAADVMELWRHARRVQRAEARAWQLFLRAAGLVDPGLESRLAEKVDALRSARAALVGEHRRRTRALYDPAEAPKQEVPDLDLAIEDEIRTLCRTLRGQLGDGSPFMQALAREALPASTTQPGAAADALRKSHAARRRLELLRRIRDQADALDAEVKAIDRRITEVLGTLKRAVDGRVCLVGLSDPRAAAMVATPVYRRMPRVEVHAQALRTMLSGAFIRAASRKDNLMVVLIAGAFAALVAATVPVGRGAMLTILLAGGYAAFNAGVVFARWHVWIVVAGPLAAMGATFLAGALFRRMTEVPAKRRVRALFAGVLSPGQVDALIADPSPVCLDGRSREVSCLRLDLVGLASLWDRLGERRTAWLLNRCFDSLTGIICERWGGCIVQLHGEGLMALFGAPLAQENHAERAVQAALASRLAVAGLDEAVQEELGASARLGCRIGVASGVAMVGNFGSRRRVAYTALGPAVELAKRLRSANRALGTQILVSEEAWRGGKSEDVLARPIGQAYLPDATQPTGVWEVCAAPAPGDETAAAYADFARAVALFAERKFEAAQELFESVLAVLPDDGLSRMYLARCRACLASAPDENWDPAIRLGER